MSDPQTRAQAERERRRRQPKIILYEPGSDPSPPKGHKSAVVMLPENGRGSAANS
jgi:hypothetical protein